MTLFQIYHAQTRETRYRPSRKAWSGSDRAEHYAHVATIQGDEDTSFNDVFRRTNHRENAWDKQEGVIYADSPVRSTSTGDVIVRSDGTAKMVDRIGWIEVDAPEDAAGLSDWYERMQMDSPYAEPPVNNDQIRTEELAEEYGFKAQGMIGEYLVLWNGQEAILVGREGKVYPRLPQGEPGVPAENWIQVRTDEESAKAALGIANDQAKRLAEKCHRWGLEVTCTLEKIYAWGWADPIVEIEEAQAKVIVSIELDGKRARPEWILVDTAGPEETEVARETGSMTHIEDLIWYRIEKHHTEVRS